MNSTLPSPPTFGPASTGACPRGSALTPTVAVPTTHIPNAIVTLLHVDESLVYESLHLARSIGGLNPWSLGHGNLSVEQTEAVISLKDCSDDEITQWLRNARSKLCTQG